jgi:putative FmdB family regulatory protein
MPIYCYKCDQCGAKIEKIQRYGECSHEECPDCQGRMERVIGPVGIIFKGSGFHVNDYKSSGVRREGKTEEKAGEKPEEKKTESATPDAATPPKEDGAKKESVPAAAKTEAVPAKTSEKKKEVA